MPTYTFLNTQTKQIEEHTCKMSEYDEFKKNNSHLERHFDEQAPGVMDPVRAGIKKPAAGFKDLLKNIKSKHRGSTIRT